MTKVSFNVEKLTKQNWLNLYDEITTILKCFYINEQNAPENKVFIKL